MSRTGSRAVLVCLGFGIYLLLHYQNFPPDVAALQQRYGALRERLNAAASPSSEAWRDLTSLLAAY